MLVKNIKSLLIMVSDLQKARELYVNVMGFEPYQEVPGQPYLQLKCGDLILMICQVSENNKDQPGKNAIVIFNVDDVETTKKVMEDQGVQFLGAIVEISGILKMAEYVDSDNNRFQLCQVLPSKGCRL